MNSCLSKMSLPLHKIVGVLLIAKKFPSKLPFLPVFWCLVMLPWVRTEIPQIFLVADMCTNVMWVCRVSSRRLW